MIAEHEIGDLLIYSSEHWAAHFQNADFDPQDSVVSRARKLCRTIKTAFYE